MPISTSGGFLGGRPPSEQWYAELPKIYPQLVIPKAYTRLALPRSVLSEPTFEVDITGWSGVPLLCARREDRGGRIDLLFAGAGQLLAQVTARMELFNGTDGTHVGVLRERAALPLPLQQLGGRGRAGEAAGPHLLLQDRAGRPILVLTMIDADATGCDFSFAFAPTGGEQLEECATAVRRPPLEGRPAEHYEIVVNPDVDAVLVLAVLLAALVFEP